MTDRLKSDLTAKVNSASVTELNAEGRREVASWIDANLPDLPEPVRIFLKLQRKYLTAGNDLPQKFDASNRELRRALGIIPSSERRPSGHPLASVPPGGKKTAKTEKERLTEKRDRSDRLGKWHHVLEEQHTRKGQRIKEKLAKMVADPKPEDEASAKRRAVIEDTPVEDIELTEEEKARSSAKTAVFVEHLELGDGAEPSLQSANETLMPSGAVLRDEEQRSVLTQLPPELFDAAVVNVLNDKRVRYDFSVAVRRLELDVEKKVVVKENGERTVVTASTDKYGPPHYSVTWSALGTLAILVGQFAIPLNRLATMLSTAGKQFKTSNLSRMLHYVATRFLPIYLELAEQLADSDIIAGDDTSCRVIEVSSYFKEAKVKRKGKSSRKKKPPWADYCTPDAAVQSIQRCRQRERDRMARRADGVREAKRTKDETPSLGMLVGRVLAFESPRQDGHGNKQSLNTTVVSGRSVAEDPKSLIVLYRSHLGSFGNLLESILRSRNPIARHIILQADLSSTNLVRDPELLRLFEFTLTGCSAHARRPFALYEHEDPVYCPFILHQFTGLAMHEQRLDAHGRNRHNVLAVRQSESRALWESIRELATEMKAKWSKATKLGTGARYIINHFDKLTAYLDDPRLEPTNNLRERMLRTEKLIEGSSMFRRSLEGRFALDIVRTVLQTAVAASIPIHEYLVSVLSADPDEIASHPEKFTPHAWASRYSADQPQSD